MEKKTKGILFIFLASIIWAVQAVLAKFAYQNSDFLHTATISFIFVFLTTAAYVGFTKKNLRVNRTQRKALLYVGFLGVIFAELMYYFGLSITQSLNVVLIAHLQPIFIIIITFVILKDEKLSSRDYVGGFFMLLSALLVSSRTLENLINLNLGTIGELAVLLGTIAWASTGVIAKKYLKGVDPGVITFYRYLPAVILLSIYLFFLSYLRIDNIYQILIGIIVALGVILYYEGLKILKTAQVGFIELCSPFFVAILAWFFFRRRGNINADFWFVFTGNWCLFYFQERGEIIQREEESLVFFLTTIFPERFLIS